MTEPDEHLVVFTPSGLRGSVPDGTTVLDTARRLGVDLDSVCGGRGICGRCQVIPTFGEFAKHGITATTKHISGRGATEEKYRGRRPLTGDSRLGCAATVCGDLVVDVPAESQVHQQVVRKEVDLGDLALDPVLVLRLVEVPKPTLDESIGERQLLVNALTDQWGLEGLTVTDDLMVDVHQALTDGNRTITVAVRDGREVVAVWPELRDRVLGAAIDVGSTTIAGHLCDLATGEVLATAGTMNPQIRFGEDLMSRISYVMMNPGGEAELTNAVRGALNELVGKLVGQVDATRDEVLELVLVGNPVMHHLFLGYDPTPLGRAPFTLAVDEALDLGAHNLTIEAHPAARVHVLPCIAGHVGADTAAVILATGLGQDVSTGLGQQGQSTRLVVDVGTNAEIVVAGHGRVLAASSPTGPAFEGAQISSGQRATPGAIERVRIDGANGEPRFRIIGVDAWSDEDDFAEAASSTGVTGICGSGIIEVVAELWMAGLMDADGVIAGAGTKPSDRIVPDGRTFSYVLFDPSELGLDGDRVLITQNDIRAIQLAKAALYAGIRLLMDHLNVETIDEIGLAGAFGSHIDTIRATVLGLVPDCDPDRVTSVGNAAGAGAAIALLSGSARKSITEVVDHIEKVETALEPAFQDHFVAAMAIPHRTADYPRLSTRITLPVRTDPSGAGSERSRRRRRRNDATREGKTP
ncbi:MAG: ASKHA domain-containing protein [Actinomycetota bacterium]|nr:ASKHA domain-containing protein [Actinomycetota bacterium]MEC9424197.1 ASKHA domain-containing protein [Actinomycetota bacterium]